LTIRLAHLSDIHFGGENVEAVEAVLAAVQALAPHLVVVTGDLTLNGLPREFAAAKAWLARLAQPQLVTPGNHDTPYWNLILRTFAPFRRYDRYIGVAEGANFEGSGVSAYAMNSARGFQARLDWSKGAVNLARIDGIAADMATKPHDLRVFACHHPLIDLPGMPVTGGVHRGARAAARLGEAGVDLILTGHVHNPFALALNVGERPSYAIGAGTLSRRTRGTPPSFMAIEADEETVNVTALAWTGAAFETFRVWPLPRRQRSLNPHVDGP
jgi:3',5'-cyclic AMP phosphodiesterase CpdA